MSYRQSIISSFKLNPGQTPWYKMFLYAITVTSPLLIGIFYHQLEISMFGALFTLVMGLIDHMGDLKSRIIHLVYSTIFILGSIYLGHFAILNFPLQLFILGLSALMLGKFKENGPELEKLILFCILYFITIADSVSLKNNITYPILYTLLGSLTYLVSLLFFNFFRKEKRNLIKSKRLALIESLANSKNNYFALIYSLTVVMSFVFSKKIGLDRAYWVTGTVLIVMLPDFNLGLNKSIQRLMGTILGVLIATFLLIFFSTKIFVLVGIFFFAFLTPLGMQRNYWFGNLTIASLIIFLIKASNLATAQWDLSKLRMIDIGIGVSFSIVLSGIFLTNFYKNLKVRVK